MSKKQEALDNLKKEVDATKALKDKSFERFSQLEEEAVSIIRGGVYTDNMDDLRLDMWYELDHLIKFTGNLHADRMLNLDQWRMRLLDTKHNDGFTAKSQAIADIHSIYGDTETDVERRRHRGKLLNHLGFKMRQFVGDKRAMEHSPG